MATGKKTPHKLTRTETVTVRLDPQLRYLAELAARRQRRSLSSYIEWAVEISLKGVSVYDGTGYNGDETITVADVAVKLWDVDDSERFVKLAINYPALLTQEEQERWKILSDSQLLAPARQRDISGDVIWNLGVLDDTVYPIVRREWPELLAAHAGSSEERAKWVAATREAVQKGAIYPGFKPEKPVSKPKGFDEMDDEIPF